MTRTKVLRLAYVCVGLTFLALAASFVPAGAALLGLGLLLGFVGGVLFLFSDDDLPRYAGFAIVGYFLLVFLAFVGSNGATIRIGDSQFFANDQPPAVLDAVFDYLVLGLPMLFVGAACVAAWETGLPRWVLVGALAGFVLVAILTAALNPSLQGDVTQYGGGAALAAVFSLTALVGAVGAFWAARNADQV